MTILVKEKICDKIKGRVCWYGRSKRACIPKEEAAFPIVILDNLILTFMTDSFEVNDVATCDIAGVFLKGDVDDFVLAKLVNKDFYIMCDVNEVFKDRVAQEWKNKVFSTNLNKEARD